jgi:hypothetical protein
MGRLQLNELSRGISDPTLSPFPLAYPPSLLLNRRMADDPPTEAPEWLRIMAERRGLARALALTPARFRPALERAAQALPPPPGGPTTEPAAVFRPDSDRNEA